MSDVTAREGALALLTARAESTCDGVDCQCDDPRGVAVTPPLYDVLSGYWTYGSHVFAVTDDLSYARTLLLERATREAGAERVARGLSSLESSLAQFEAYGHAYVSFGDYKYEIRRSQIVVAVGALSTLGASCR